MSLAGFFFIMRSSALPAIHSIPEKTGSLSSRLAIYCT